MKKKEDKIEKAKEAIGMPKTEGGAKPEAKTQDQQQMAAVVKEIENALFAVKFYPVAVDEDTKDEAMEKLVRIYNKGSETVRQLLLYMIHEILATNAELKIVHNFDYFKARNPALDPAQLRMSVYRAMFNYNTSIEGLVGLIKLLGRFKGSDDSAKVLTYHFSHLCGYENEATHMLRAAIIETLGKAESQYALNALLDYARYNDNERTSARIVSALIEWQGRIDKLKISQKEKEKLRQKLQEIVTKEARGSHYG